MDNIISLLASDNYIMYNINIASALGIEAAIMLGELARKWNYWNNENKLTPDGYFFITRSDIKKDTALNEHYQRKGLEKLIAAGIVSISKKGGFDRSNYYRINSDAILKIRTFTTCTFERQNGEPSNVNDVHDTNTTTNTTTNTIISNSIENENVIESNPAGSFNKEDNINTYKGEDCIQACNSSKKKESANSKAYSTLMTYINTLPATVPAEVRASLTKWYEAHGRGKVTVQQLKDKLTSIYNQTNGDYSLIQQSIEAAYLNSWMAFYPPKNSYKSNSNNAKSNLTNPSETAGTYSLNDFNQLNTKEY